MPTRSNAPATSSVMSRISSTEQGSESLDAWIPVKNVGHDACVQPERRREAGECRGGYRLHIGAVGLLAIRFTVDPAQAVQAVATWRLVAALRAIQRARSACSNAGCSRTAPND